MLEDLLELLFEDLLVVFFVVLVEDLTLFLLPLFLEPLPPFLMLAKSIFLHSCVC